MRVNELIEKLQRTLWAWFSVVRCDIKSGDTLWLTDHNGAIFELTVKRLK